MPTEDDEEDGGGDGLLPSSTSDSLTLPRTGSSSTARVAAATAARAFCNDSRPAVPTSVCGLAAISPELRAAEPGKDAMAESGPAPTGRASRLSSTGGKSFADREQSVRKSFKLPETESLVACTTHASTGETPASVEDAYAAACVAGTLTAAGACAGYPCWLLQTVLLHGMLYLTTNYLCFYTTLTKQEDVRLGRRSDSLRTPVGRPH